MVVGRGEAGKSATLDSLLGRPFKEGRESTVGAETSESFSVDKQDVQAWTVVDEAGELARAPR